MTDKLRAAAEAALEALINGKNVRAGEGGTKRQSTLEDAAIEQLRTALAEPEAEQEPGGVGRMVRRTRVHAVGHQGRSRMDVALIGDTIFVPFKPPPSARRKFSEDEVREIRASSVPATELARALGVTPSCIRAIRHGFNYAWVI